ECRAREQRDGCTDDREALAPTRSGDGCVGSHRRIVAAQGGNSLANVQRFDIARLRGVPREQSPVTDQVDHARDTMRSAKDLIHRLLAEADLTARAGNVQAVMDVAISLLLVEI